MKVICKNVSTISEFVDGIRLRVEAFIIEQGCKPGWEPDEKDRDADHYIAKVDGKVVGVLRVVREGAKVFKIERMVTLQESRKLGVGRQLLAYVLSELRIQGAEKIWMQAQSQAQGFYEKCGFVSTSSEYDLYGILHLDMEYALDSAG